MAYKMKNVQFILIIFLFTGCMKTKTYEEVKSFSLVTIEDYGCEERNTNYTEIKYSNDAFTILYSNGRELNYEILKKEDFYRFYDSLLMFNPFEFKDNYEYEERQSTADGLGRMMIVINDTISKKIRYTAMPFDETEFGKFHHWIIKRRTSLDTNLNFTTLIKSDFHNNRYISNWAALNSIERNKSNFSINDILKTIDTTTNQKLKEVMISSLAFFKDKRIVELLGPMLLLDLDKNKELNWWPYTMLELTPILAQDSSELKIEYLKLFLKSKNGIVRTQSSIALANYRIIEGREPLLDTIRNYLNGSKYAVMDEVFFALTKIANDSVLHELISFYDKMKITEKGWKINDLIATLKVILTDKKISYDRFYSFIRNMNVEKEIVKLDKELQAITKAIPNKDISDKFKVNASNNH